ncbi:MAG: hypothetical protein ACM3UU_08310 [Ignavibacteriales bacterium]
MSFPNIPDVSPDIEVNRDQVINLLLASIAFEELGLAHIINSEGEKIQFVIGTLEGHTPSAPPTMAELLEINRSVEQTLRSVIKNQMLLQFKLEDVLEIPGESTTTTTSTSTTTTTESTTTTTSTSTTTTTTESTTTTTSTSTTTTTESTTTTTSTSTTTTTESTTTTTSTSTTTTTTESTTTTTTESTTTTTTESTTTTTTESTTTTTTESTTTTTTESTTTTTTESTTTTTESTTTTSTTTTATTTTCEGSAWGEGTSYGTTGNAQYFILPNGQTSITVNLVLGATHVDIGDVTATRSGNTLSVTFTTNSSYILSEVQVEVSNNTVPSTSIPGQFDNKHTITDPSEYHMYTFTNIDVTGFTNIYIAAHAKVFGPCV